MLKINEGFVMRNILDEWIIVPLKQQNSAENYIMTVNESGHMLWELLEKGTTEEELLQRMLEEYDVDEKTAKADISTFLTALSARGVL